MYTATFIIKGVGRMGCISEILNLKGEQQVLIPEGNWIAVEGGGTYQDYEYLIVLNTNGHRCGYVAIPPEHKYSKTPEEERTFMGEQLYKHYDYDSLDIQCHGGLTFMSPSHELKDLLDVACNDMWIGFDCGHCYDSCDEEAMRKYYGDELVDNKKSFIHAMNGNSEKTVKNYDYVRNECESIINQLIKAA